MINIGIDPGTTRSAFAVLVAESRLIEFGILPNEELLKRFRDGDFSSHVATFEEVRSYGMAVGKSVFETVLWCGRFMEAYENQSQRLAYRLGRLDVKLHLCKSPKAKDANVRQAIIDRYEPTGGGKEPAIGIKSNKGPLFGVSKDVWAALGVAITWRDQK